MPHPVLRGDGTIGTAVDLLRGQPRTDPRYAGAAPANELESILWAPLDAYVISDRTVITCDPPGIWDIPTRWVPAIFVGYDGDYPHYVLGATQPFVGPVVVPPV